VEAAFPDAHDPPPPGWTGPVFKLSQNYPATRPNLEPVGKRKWTQLDYCLEGNTANNFADISQNTIRKWYHAPWSTEPGCAAEPHIRK
jgi:hypothetical protein